MVIGSCQVILYLPGVTSLKSKRSILQRIKTQLRNNFNISIAEVGDNDLWQKSVIGISCVSNKKQYAQGILDNVMNFLNREHRIQIVDYQIEI